MQEKLPQKTIDGLYNGVKQIITESRNTVYQAANFAMVQAYWNIGRLIVEEEQSGSERAAYGKRLIKSLSAKLTSEFGKGFDISNLRHMRNFYSDFPKHDALRRELSWTHYRLLLKVHHERARAYYMQSAAEEKWSTRELERQIHTQYYERVLSHNPKHTGKITPQKTAEKKFEPKDIIKDPFILEFLDIKPSERTQEHIGQMDFYVRYFEDQIKVKGDNPTIGLILCAEKGHAIAKYSLLSENKQIFASKYKTFLPTEEELQREIERGRHQIEMERKLQEPAPAYGWVEN